MVLRKLTDGECICIPQSEHARLSGALALAWGNDEFDSPHPRTEVALGAELHDIGMDPYDADPDTDEDGVPIDFMRMPLDRHLECWRRGPSIAAERDRYAGLLVSLHGAALMASKKTKGEEERRKVADYLDRQVELRERWRAEIEEDPHLGPYLDPDTIERNRRLVALWDAISLDLCMGRDGRTIDSTPAGKPEVVLTLTHKRGSDSVHVSPWPFAGDGLALDAVGRVGSADGPERKLHFHLAP